MATLKGRALALISEQSRLRTQRAALQERVKSMESRLVDMAARNAPLAPLTEEPYVIEVSTIYRRYHDALRDRDRLVEMRDQQSATCEKTSREFLLEQKALAFYSKVLDEITKDYVDSLSGTLGNVYSYVFQNPSKRATLEMVDRYNKKVLVPTLITTDEEGNDNPEGLDDSGFSVSVVLGTVLLVHYILHNNLTRVVFFDESFGGLSDETAARFFSLIREFTTQFGFRFMLISHESRFVEYVDRSYFVRRGRFVLEEKEAVS